MGKSKLQASSEVQRRARNNKRKGNNLELEIIKKLKEIGYDGCVSSRSQNKLADANKIDIVDTKNELNVNIQSKYTQNTPDYFGIRDACTEKDKPFTVIWKKTGKDGKRSPGTIAMIPVEFFYELLKNQKAEE
jgi:hypothetical protein